MEELFQQLRRLKMSVDTKPLKVGDKAPMSETGAYTVIAVNEQDETVLLEWWNKGRRFECWYPREHIEIPTKQ
jgi:hypothetical protein